MISWDTLIVRAHSGRSFKGLKYHTNSTHSVVSITATGINLATIYKHNPTIYLGSHISYDGLLSDVLGPIPPDRDLTLPAHGRVSFEPQS